MLSRCLKAVPTKNRHLPKNRVTPAEGGSDRRRGPNNQLLLREPYNGEHPISIWHEAVIPPTQRGDYAPAVAPVVPVEQPVAARDAAQGIYL